ncbi:MAG: TIGR01212 family radical SAM protein [Oscillospiraceae bacterium]|nr:TIGR01212 family radical SAM protein [Oscillospiraceae bacterium]
MKETQAARNPFPHSDSNKRYHTWDYALRKKFGGKVFKVSLDAGFSCPNIDGTRGKGGCTYCSYAFHRQTPEDLLAQFRASQAQLHKKWPDAVQYIPYFQANTNTYAPLDELKAKYETVLGEEGVVGLAVATRADALPDDVCDYLEELSRRTWLMVELGLQTVHDETARRINRGHTMAEFLEGYQKLRSRGIPVCVHIINGLPGEDKEMMLETARQVAALKPDCLKIHLLHVIEGTPMAEEYKRGEFRALEFTEYVDIVCDQLELLPPETVLQRVTGDGLKETLVAPLWSLKKLVVINEIDKELLRRDSWQGKYCGGSGNV